MPRQTAPEPRRGRGRPSLGPDRLEIRVDLTALADVQADGETAQQFVAAAIQTQIKRRRRRAQRSPQVLSEREPATAVDA